MALTAFRDKATGGGAPAVVTANGDAQITVNRKTISLSGDVKIKAQDKNAWTVESTAQIDTEQADPFGNNTGVGLFDGDSDGLWAADSMDWAITDRDFTMECWFKTDSSVTTTEYLAYFPYGPTLQNGWNVVYLSVGTTSGKLALYAGISSGSNFTLTSTTSVDDQNWHHVAVVRNGSSWEMYVDGVMEASTTSSISIVHHTDGRMTVGCSYYNGSYASHFGGYISGFRLSLDKARYNYNFAVPTALPTPDRWDVSILNMQGTDESTTFTDSVAPGITANSSIYFDGTGDAIQSADNDDWDFGTGDFTVECWIRNPGVSADTTILGQWGSSATSASSWLLRLNSAGTISFLGFEQGQTWPTAYIDGGTSTTVIDDNKWHHIAVVRNGTNILLFIDGVLESVDGDVASREFNNGTEVLDIGGSQAGYNAFAGNMSDIRITKGLARYLGGFPVPTSGFARDPWTALLINGHGGEGSTFIPDSSSGGFGNGYGVFDGSDYLTLPYRPDWNLEAEDFTIEMWVRFTTLQDSALVAYYPDQETDRGWIIRYDYDETDITQKTSSGANAGWKFYPKTGILVSGDNGAHDTL